MTPERQKWWRTLPVAEKRARLTIKLYKIDIKINKMDLQNSNEDCLKRFYADEINTDKKRIKDLRKRIALNLTADKKCPACGQFYVFSQRTLKKHNTCPNCGQHTLSPFYDESIGGYIENTKTALDKVKLC